MDPPFTFLHASGDHMANIDRHEPGTFCWIELAADDAAAAKRFYAGLFGWTPEDSKYGEGEADVYTTYNLHGRKAAASYGMDAGQRQMGIPSHWLPYVCVERADDAAARVRELGGTVLAGPFDVMEHGRMAMVQDPGGAAFALWEPKRHPGVGVYGETGALGWTELATNDPDAARAFYGALFGWTAAEEDVGMPYTIFSRDGQMVGGMYRLTPEMAGMPPSWSPYFVVDDADASADRARELGAEILLPPTDIPGTGRFALIRDPQGAMFNLIRMTGGSSS